MTGIEDLATRIDADWRMEDYAAAVLPALAARHLSGPLAFDLSAVIEHIAGSRELPAQRRTDQAFGQPAVTLHANPHFEVEALFWHTATPAIHQHSFEGAFRLISGRSVHCYYDFSATSELDGVVIGCLSRRRLAMLTPGDAVEIPKGAALIHSIFHIDTPSVTLVVRTPQDETPERTYLPPGLAYDTRDRSARLHKRLQLIDTLAITRHPDYASTVDRIAASGSLYDGLTLMLRLGGHGAPDEVYSAAEEALHRRFAGFAGIRTVLAGAREERRRSRLVAHRARMVEPADRVVLALLLAADHQDEIVDEAMAFADGRDGAVDMLALSASRLVGGDETRLMLARAAILTELEHGGEDAFLRLVDALSATSIQPEAHTSLLSFRASVLDNPLLSPLIGAWKTASASP
ncbi:hypothetical protein ACC680_32480 [Rhizobium ruizarguesonis]